MPAPPGSSWSGGDCVPAESQAVPRRGRGPHRAPGRRAPSARLERFRSRVGTADAVRGRDETAGRRVPNAAASEMLQTERAEAPQGLVPSRRRGG